MTKSSNHTPRAAGMTVALWAAVGSAILNPASSPAQELTEIVVTARKVEEKLKDVPLAITAFDSAAIETRGITNLQDVANLTPGLSFFNAFGENLPVATIRGIVPQDIFGQLSAAVFVDNVYVSGREGINFSQLDIERIEVLKGPQSAVWGRNAFSGGINYITKAPSNEFSSRTELEVGNRGKQKVKAVVSGPILGDKLTARLSGLVEDWDGSYDNTLAGGNDIGGHTYRSLQGKLRWLPADSLDINLGLYISKDDIDDPATANVPVNCEDQVEQRTNDVDGGPLLRLQNWCGALPDLAATPDALDPSQFPIRVSLPGSVTRDSMPKNPRATGEQRDLLRGNFNVVWDASIGTFSFLTGFSDTKQKSVSDFERSLGEAVPLAYCNEFASPGVATCLNPNNFSWAPMGFVNQENGNTTQEWSQELRFTSPRDERLRYSTGFYYYNVDEKDHPGELIATTPLPSDYNGFYYPNIGIGPVAYPTSLAIGSYIFGPSLTPDGTIDPLNRLTDRKKTEAWSIFGTLDFDVTEALKARAEIRLSNEAKDNFAYEYKRCAQPNPSNDPSYSQYNVSVFPFNSPPVSDCGDDFQDLRVVEPCRAIDVDDQTQQVYETGAFITGDTNGDGIIKLFDDGSCIPGPDEGTARFRTVTGRIGLDYKFESGWLVYGSIAKGEKPGDLQLIRADVVLAGGVGSELISNRFEPETLIAYELGMKGYSANHRVSLDVAIFYNDWRDIVLRQLTDTSPVTGRPFNQLTALNFNSGDAKVWGWEGTAEVLVTDNLKSRVTVGYTDSQLKNARQDSFALFPSFYTTEPTCAPAAIQAIPDPTPARDPGTNGPGDPGYDNDPGNEAQNQKAGECRKLSGDVSGNTQMRQPEWTASASLDYNHILAGDWEWTAGASANYTGKIFVGNDNQAWLPPRTNVDMRLGASTGRYSIEFWVRNLLNNNNPIAAFRDIVWTNDDDTRGNQNPTSIRDASTFDDFPPLRLSVTYPSLRTFGLVGKVKFGAEQR